MKLMVDFSEKDWKFMQKTYKETGLSFIPSEIKNECVKAVYNGTPYEEHKKGKWIDNNCSCCGNKALLQRCYSMDGTWLEYDLSNYCPDCGAKMEGNSNE